MTTDRPFQHVVELLRRANGLSAKKPPTQKSDDDEDERTEADERDNDPDDVEKKPKKTKKKSRDAIEDDEGGGEDDQSEQLKPKSLTPDQAQAMARRIIRSGEKRRAQVPPALPANRTARLIVLNGMRRRNEISDDEYERLARG